MDETGLEILRAIAPALFEHDPDTTPPSAEALGFRQELQEDTRLHLEFLRKHGGKFPKMVP